jgi:peptidoglycan/xylan/chitin deacetylase (PgdA/CDA1 family)
VTCEEAGHVHDLAGRAEVKDGYAMGNHTWNHPDMDSLTAAQQAAELDEASAEQRSIAGTVPCAFRPPHGDYDSTTLRLAQQRRMGVWLWSVDTQDWMAEGSGSSYWVQRIIRLAEEERPTRTTVRRLPR